MAKIHRLKTWPGPFQALAMSVKTFELRKNDRGYEVGDFLVLDEWSPEDGYVEAAPLIRQVSYVLTAGFGLRDGFVAMAVESVSNVVEDTIRLLAPPRADAPTPTGEPGGEG